MIKTLYHLRRVFVFTANLGYLYLKLFIELGRALSTKDGCPIHSRLLRMGGIPRTQIVRLCIRAGAPSIRVFCEWVGYHEPKSSGFVSGHEFTRAENNPSKEVGFSPCGMFSTESELI